VEDYRWSNLDEILKTYQENEKYKELLEIIFDEPITKEKEREFIEWLNSENEENIEEIKKNHQQLIMDGKHKEEIFKKIERRNKAGISARRRRRAEKIDYSELHNKIREIVLKYFKNNIYNPWKSKKTAIMHCIWYIMSVENNVRLRLISEWYRIPKVQTISSALRKIRLNSDKQKIINKIIERIEY